MYLCQCNIHFQALGVSHCMCSEAAANKCCTNEISSFPMSLRALRFFFEIMEDCLKVPFEKLSFIS